MKARIVAFVALAVGLAAVFVRLGIWQLDKLSERHAANDMARHLLALPAIAAESLKFVLEQVNRHAIVSGVPDYDREFVHAGRSRNGSPGVHIYTPIRTGDGDTFLVNRGWVYAADAATVDPSRWREERRTFHGYVRKLPMGDRTASPQSKVVRLLNSDAITKLFPYPVSNLYVVSLDSAGEHVPARLPQPDLTNGPHLSYAIQWFCFAAIALIGAAIVVFRGLGPRPAGAAGA